MLTAEKSEHKFLFTTFYKKNFCCCSRPIQTDCFISLDHTKAKVVYQPFRAIFIKVQTTFV